MRDRRAVNVSDLIYPDAKVAVQFMLAPVTMLKQVVRVDRTQPDSSALVLECGPEQADAILDFLRKIATRAGRVLRTYREGPRGGWSPIKRTTPVASVVEED
jgi:hypothetical protein